MPKNKKLRKSPTQRRAAETIDVILEASCLVLNELGVEKFFQFSTTTVAAKAGVSIGTLYQYFPNKEALLAEVLDYCNRVDFALAKSIIVANKDEGPYEAIQLCIKGLLKQRYQKFDNLYKVFAIYRHLIIREETNIKIQEKIVLQFGQLLESEMGLNLSNSKFLAFLIVRGFTDITRSTLIYRPEYIWDESFHETFCQFLTQLLLVCNISPD